MGTMAITYRTSHLSKGSDYHAKFSSNPRRRLLWSLEQHILDAIYTRYLAGKRIDYLDFACGTGRVLAHFESRTNTSTGVDLSPTMLEIARSTTSSSTIVQGDITQKDILEGAEFDLITAFRFFPNAEPDLRGAAMSALKCHLRRGGILVFNNHVSTTSLNRRLARLATLGRRGNGGMSPAEVDSLVATAGLHITRTYHAGIVPESESMPWPPRRLIGAIEHLGTRLPIAWIAENIIYVCCHRAEVP